MEAIQARVKAARKKKHKPATVSDNIKRVVAIITWLVLKSLTQALTPDSQHEHRVKVGSTSYWFDHIPAYTFFAILTNHIRKYNLRFDQFLY